MALMLKASLVEGNRKGVKESGKLFAAPTYFFIAMMGLLIVVGIVKWAGGALHAQDLGPLLEHARHGVRLPAKYADAVDMGLKGKANLFLYGAGLFVALKAFASGGDAVTGVEAISNGVTAFRRPEWLNARKTLIIMGATLGVLFLGLSVLSTKTRPVPYKSGTPTVISQVGKGVFGGGASGHALFYMLQAGT